MDAFAVVSRLVLTVVFAVSGIAKLRDREGTRRAVEGFGLPSSLGAPVAAGLPLAECAVSLTLIPGTSARGAALVALALLAAFTVGISINLAKGRRPDCNCFGQLRPAPIGPSTLVRNLVLAAAAGVVAFGAGAGAGGSVPDAVGDLDATGLAIASVAVGAIAVAVALLGRKTADLITGSQPAAEATRQPSGPPVGTDAPAFTLPDSSGDMVALADLLERGKRALLVFFSPSCGPCARIAPELARWQRDFPNRLTVAVLSSGTPVKVRESATQYDIAEMLVDEGGVVAKSYGSRGTPGAILIDANGMVASEYAAGDAAIKDLLIESFGLTDVVAAVAAEKEAGEEAAHEDDDHDHGEHAPAPERDVFDPESIDGAFVPVARRDVTMADRESETVLVDRATGAVHLLNPTAAIVWQCLDGSGTVDEIAFDIADVFARDTDEILGSVLEAVRRFGRQGLLEGVGISPEKTASARPSP